MLNRRMLGMLSGPKSSPGKNLAKSCTTSGLSLGGRCSAHAIAGDACGPGNACPACDTDAVGARAKDSCEAEVLAMTKALRMRAAGIECSGSVTPMEVHVSGGTPSKSLLRSDASAYADILNQHVWHPSA